MSETQHTYTEIYIVSSGGIARVYVDTATAGIISEVDRIGE